MRIFKLLFLFFFFFFFFFSTASCRRDTGHRRTRKGYSLPRTLFLWPGVVTCGGGDNRLALMLFFLSI